ncbi:MAG: cysteine--tRNA ligase [Candidatus Marinimicrobia bacterium]|mgnify:CR=1 FL=1|nr:cysteine--tRNA ligase [Candidatus Neomarinimicrobiota bacterium]MDP6456079.1 cysteine--tRNA ligase [Candidatus Neomarinimicrobiota bacterium]MDP6592863.1 cysteine--tRNA ligase [Candidatus Neomarinimicrobiota bacterium]MDP6836136.1 cysteine--tRNA ligase [Candidatus Neomarinimicrobiota bacterium]MDP6965868.1 cysteine--tRNA ligase [Candidatus Neomarinimicrobiota bacterium]
MGLRLHNTFTRRVEEFKPIEGDTVRLYTCGPTLYDFAHIGNCRSFLFFDLLKRYLRFIGYRVLHVMNLTDVDDKIIAKCAEENETLVQFTERYRAAFMEDVSTLGILEADEYPAATQHIPHIIDLISSLMDRGHAYATDDGSVFFKLSSYPEYGRLSRIDTQSLTSTQRVADDEYDKENINDFALWKGWKPEDGEVSWDAPWGRGRPGWHVECSAMSMQYLGEEFDIHCGGVDLIFPHHENEIAQSICATGGRFANCWVHCEHLIVDGTKMSKSLGNYYTLPALLKKGYNPLAIRYLLISSHYRQKINLTEEHLAAADNSVLRLQDFKRRLEGIAEIQSGELTPDSSNVLEEFTSAMNKDLNIAEAMGFVFNWVREENRRIDDGKLKKEEASHILSILSKIDSVIGVTSEDEVELSQEDLTLIEEREAARDSKDWARSDEIRHYFLKKGLQLEDTPSGTVVKRISGEVR